MQDFLCVPSAVPLHCPTKYCTVKWKVKLETDKQTPFI